MRVASAWSTAPNATDALTEALASLTGKLGGHPTFLFVHFTERYSAELIRHTLQRLPPETKVHGCTSCVGVMTEQGFHSESGRALGLFGVLDPAGSYGVGASRQGETARQAASAALNAALANAGRPGELPHLIWLTAAPGNEEKILKGIQDVVGPDVPVMGGSAADNEVKGNWSLVTRDAVYDDAVLISVAFPSFSLSHSFQSGYSPTHHRGIVTSATGRIVHKIDQRPAREVYNAWTGGLLNDIPASGGNILSMTTLAPLGQVVGKVGEVSYYSLSHPNAVLENGSLSLFTEVAEGQEVFLMSGSKESMISRAGRVAETAIELEDVSPSAVDGAVVVYCAGCMLTVQSQMPAVVQTLNKTLRGKPFLGIFTFGEQGCLLGGKVSHGNLMISALIFSE
jgi:hypothetical protein